MARFVKIVKTFPLEKSLLYGIQLLNYISISYITLPVDILVITRVPGEAKDKL